MMENAPFNVDYELETGADVSGKFHRRERNFYKVCFLPFDFWQTGMPIRFALVKIITLEMAADDLRFPV